jgi:site-specific DNA recombinase
MDHCAMVARLHPNVATVYREKIARLREALNAEDTRTEAAETIRGLIEEVRLVPEEGRLRVESGELAALISLANQHPRSSGTRVPVTLVAGARNHREFPICVALQRGRQRAHVGGEAPRT